MKGREGEDESDGKCGGRLLGTENWRWKLDERAGLRRTRQCRRQRPTGRGIADYQITWTVRWLLEG
jgi:hypothetical protein